jgi:hypothetical protein
MGRTLFVTQHTKVPLDERDLTSMPWVAGQTEANITVCVSISPLNILRTTAVRVLPMTIIYNNTSLTTVEQTIYGD